MNYLDFAFRNIKRHKKRSFVTIFTICLGFTALGVIGGILNNIFSRLSEQAIIVEKLGHITIAKEGFFKNGKISPEDYLWKEDELAKILQILRSDPEVDIATPRLSLFGLISNGKSSTIFITEAIVPKDDHELMKMSIDGRTKHLGAISLSDKPSKQSEVAIGSELATNLGLSQGEYLTLLTSTKDGIANALDVDIDQIYNTGNPATNDKFVLTNFYLAQKLYDTQGAERIVITIKDLQKLKEVQKRLTAKLRQSGFAIESKPWNEISLTYDKVKKMFSVIFRVLTIIITVIVLLTLLNTMQMTVTERTREIGTIRAIGMLRKNVIKIFCIEGVLMGLIGCFLGFPILLGISQILKSLHVTFTPPVASTEVPIALILKPTSIIPVFVLFCIASLASSFIASRRIAKQKVVTSLMNTN